MKRFLIILLLVGCIDTNPEPSISNIEGVSVAGLSVKNLGEEVSLFLSVHRLPKRNNWELVWKINGIEINREAVPRSNTSLLTFHRYTPQSTGQFVYEGCISNGEIEVCRAAHFSVIE